MTAQVTADPDLDWRRPHPYAIVAELANSLRSILAAAAAIQTGVLDGAIGLEVAVAALPLVGALGRWLTTRYAVGPEFLLHNHGLLIRRRQVLPRANVQNVATRAGLVARLGSVVELQVSDASSNGDISIRYISEAEAERLTVLLRNRRDGGAAAPVGPGGALRSVDEPEQPGASDHTPPSTAPVERAAVVAPDLSDLVRTELTSLEVLLAIGTSVLLPVLVLGVAGDRFPGPASDRWGLIGLVAAAGMPLVLGAAHVVSRLLATGEFRLVSDPDRLRIRSGLLTEDRMTARRERIQLIRVIRQVWHRRRGVERVEFETADTQTSADSGTNYLAPTAAAGTWVALATDAFGTVEVAEADLGPVSPLTRRRATVRIGIGTAVAAAALALVSPVAAVLLVGAAAPLARWYGQAHFRATGYAMSEGQLLVRRGVLQQTLTLVLISKIQVLRVESSFFQRRVGLATLRLATAGSGSSGSGSALDLRLAAGPVRIVDLPLAEAEELLVRLGAKAAATPDDQVL